MTFLHILFAIGVVLILIAGAALIISEYRYENRFDR